MTLSVPIILGETAAVFALIDPGLCSCRKQPKSNLEGTHRVQTYAIPVLLLCCSRPIKHSFNQSINQSINRQIDRYHSIQVFTCAQKLTSCQLNSIARFRKLKKLQKINKTEKSLRISTEKCETVCNTHANDNRVCASVVCLSAR